MPGLVLQGLVPELLGLLGLVPELPELLEQALEALLGLVSLLAFLLVQVGPAQGGLLVVVVLAECVF